MQNREYLGKLGSIKVYKCIFLYPKFSPSISPRKDTQQKETDMMVETMNEGKDKYKVDLLNEVNLNKKFLQSLVGTVYLKADHRTVAGMNKYENKVAKLENNGFTSFDFHYENGFFIGHFKRRVAQ